MTQERAGLGTSLTEVTIYQLLTPLARRWRIVVVVPVMLAVAAGALSYTVAEVYTASTSFSPAAPAGSTLPSGLGSLAGLAGQLGIGMNPGGVPTPEYFASVLESRELLDTLLRSEFHDSGTGGPRRLLDILPITARDSTQRVGLAIRRMRQLISTQVDGRTGIVSVSVRQGDPRLAADVANQAIALLNQFNLERRQSQSREQLRFTAQRFAEAEAELRAAEAELEAFLLANRQYQGSPLLEFEYARLDRMVQLKQAVYTNLATSHEDARIAVVRDTPVITVIDRAVTPYLRTAPVRRLYVVVAGLFGLALGALIAYMVDLRARSSGEGRADYRELTDALHGVRTDLGRLIGRGR
ncbi:MAG: GNVR domain-containing protein [Longimicrobiales bacterium]